MKSLYDLKIMITKAVDQISEPDLLYCNQWSELVTTLKLCVDENHLRQSFACSHAKPNNTAATRTTKLQT